jgi:hypothetical protein
VTRADAARGHRHGDVAVAPAGAAARVTVMVPAWLGALASTYLPAAATLLVPASKLHAGGPPRGVFKFRVIGRPAGGDRPLDAGQAARMRPSTGTCTTKLAVQGAQAQADSELPRQ